MVRVGIERGPEAFVRQFETDQTRLPAAHRRRLLAHDYHALLAVAQDRPDLSAMLPTVTVPSVLLVGSEDEVYQRAAAAAQAMPNARLVTLPGLDHGCLGRHDLVLPHLRRFWDEVEAARAAESAKG